MKALTRENVDRFDSINRRIATLRREMDGHHSRKQEIATPAVRGSADAMAEFFGHCDAMRRIEVELEALHMARDQL
jgi:hypothetical protein